MGVGGHRHTPAVLPPVKTRYLLYRGLGGPQNLSGGAEKLVPTGIRYPDRPAHSESLYPLRYAGSPKRFIRHWNTCNSKVTLKKKNFFWDFTSCRRVHSYGRLESSNWSRLLDRKSIRHFKITDTMNQSPWHNIKEDSNLHQHRCENIRFRS